MGACYSTNDNGLGDKIDNYDEDHTWWKSMSDKKINSKSTDFKFKFKFGSGGGKGQVAEDHVSGKISGNGSCSIASLYTQQGKKGTNQDAMIVWEKFSSTSDAVFCGVFDGHGPYGHMVAKKVRDSLPALLSTHWTVSSDGIQNGAIENGSANGSIHEEDELLECERSEVEEKETIPDKYLPLKYSILKSFELMDSELCTQPSIDCFCSGTTAVTLVKQDQDLIIGNIGDSRAVLATEDEHNSLVAVQLTVDLKPNLPREAARIQKFKGRVFALQDEPEVARVWLPNSDSPGLAMARAFGDFCLKDFGLISVPDIYYHHITDKDKFVILASDGVWDVLSNKEAVEIVASAPGRSTAARALVECATRSWKLKYPTSKIDDCAVVCLFLDQKPPPASTNEKVKQPPVGLDASFIEHSGTVTDSNEKENGPGKTIDGSKRSLGECISASEDEEWSALEGEARVNSLLSIPRFLSTNKRS